MKPLQGLRLLARGIRTSASRHQVPGSLKEAPKDMGAIPGTSGYQRVQRIQKKWMADPETWVQHRGGLMDQMVYNATVVACVVSVIYSVLKLKQMAFPKKAE